VSREGLPAGHPLAGEGGRSSRVRVGTAGRRRWAANAEVFMSSKGVLGTRYLELGPPPGGARRGRRSRRARWCAASIRR
jgi:hypothetical protein